MAVASGGVAVQARIKQIFFDRAKVIAVLDKDQLSALHKAAGNIRRHARRSLKKTKKGEYKRREKYLQQVRWNRGKRKAFRDPTVSQPGDPPKVHTGDPGNLRRVLYGYDTHSDRVIIGPLRFNTPVNVPALMEHGGQATMTVYPPFVVGKQSRSVTIKPRPFMRPALEKELPNIERLWKDIIRAG